MINKLKLNASLKGNIFVLLVGKLEFKQLLAIDRFYGDFLSVNKFGSLIAKDRLIMCYLRLTQLQFAYTVALIYKILQHESKGHVNYLL